MQNKKRLSILLILVMVLTLVACGNGAREEAKQDKTPQKTLYENGMDVINLMVEATRNENYVYIYTASEEIQEILQEIGKGDFEEPDRVFAITGNAEVFANLLELNEIEGMSKNLESHLNNRMFSALVNQMNARAGVDYLAAASVCTMGKTFVDESLDNNVIYMYVYKDATPVAVTFIPGEDGAVSASGCFIMSDDFLEEIDNMDDMEELLEDFGLEVEEVEVQ